MAMLPELEMPHERSAYRCKPDLEFLLFLSEPSDVNQGLVFFKVLYMSSTGKRGGILNGKESIKKAYEVLCVLQVAVI